MKSSNIVKKLQKEGYKVVYKKWSYWDNVPHVKLNGFDFAIAEIKGGNWISLNQDFIYNEVLNGISTAERINKILDENKNYNYSMYKIYSMGDYYKYKKNQYPYNELRDILQKINTI